MSERRIRNVLEPLDSTDVAQLIELDTIALPESNDNDDELLDYRRGLPQNDAPIIDASFMEEPDDFVYEESIPERVVEHIVKHPSSSVAEGMMFSSLGTSPVGWGWGLAEALAALDPLSKKIGIRLGSPSEFIKHMDEHPDDWKHLFGFEDKYNSMRTNPEDYPE
jgi:hypothetical protein